jgi:hypothetical protein
MQGTQLPDEKVVMTPAMVGYLHGLEPRGFLQTIVVDMIKRRDIDNLEIILSHPDVYAKPWGTIHFELLPLREDKDPRAAALYSAWNQEMTGGDPKNLDRRLQLLAERNTNGSVSTELDEIKLLLAAGANIEALIGSTGRTPLGTALHLGYTNTVVAMLQHFYAGNPQRMPLAAKGKAMIPYVIEKKMLALDYERLDFVFAQAPTAEEKIACTKIIAKQLSEGKFGDDLTSRDLRVLWKIIVAGMIDDDVLVSLWNVDVELLLDNLSKQPASMGLEIAIEAIQKFIDAGVDINKPREDSIAPLHWVMSSGTPEFLGHFLDLGVDLGAAAESLRARPEHLFRNYFPDMRAALQSAVARHKMGKIHRHAAFSKFDSLSL